MTPGPGIEPGTRWWKASALTTAPTLEKAKKVTFIATSFIFRFEGDMYFFNGKRLKNVILKI